MKILNTLLIGSSILLGHAAANPDTLGFELVQFYYVYKMEFKSNLAEENRRLGVICTKAKKGLCSFDEFVYLILETGDLKTFWKANGAANYHTENPGDAEASAISSRAAADERIDASAMSTTFPSSAGNVPYADVVQDVTRAAENAAAAGGVAKADVDTAASYAKRARKIREDKSFPFVRTAMRRTLGDGAKYLDYDQNARTFGWRTTLAKLQTARTANEITDEQFKDYKNAIRDASHGILKNTPDINKVHWAAAKSFTTFVSKASAISTNLAAPPDTAPEPSRGWWPVVPFGIQTWDRSSDETAPPAPGAGNGPDRGPSSFLLSPHLSVSNGAMDVDVVSVY